MLSINGNDYEKWRVGFVDGQQPKRLGTPDIFMPLETRNTNTLHSLDSVSMPKALPQKTQLSLSSALNTNNHNI